MITKLKKILYIIFSLLLFSCENQTKNDINVSVSIEPQEFLVKKIGGDKVDVSVFIKAGMSPENFEPLPSHLFKLSNSDIYFTIGLPFEDRILSNLSNVNPNLQTIALDQNIVKRNTETIDEIFGPASSDMKNNLHEESGLKDPHTWMSPSQLKSQAEIIYKTFAAVDAGNLEYYNRNYTELLMEIDSVREIISKNLSNISSRIILVFHPAWGYFCDDFNLTQIPIEIEGKEPGIQNISLLIDFIKKNNLKYILAETQNNSPALNSIADELTIKILRNDPLSGDYLNNIVELSELIEENN